MTAMDIINLTFSDMPSLDSIPPKVFLCVTVSFIIADILAMASLAR